MEQAKFKHAFAIGDGCNMAAALSRTGLREKSGPFDWVICHIEDVMQLVDNHFEDYLNPDCLEPDPIPFNAGQRKHTRYKSLLFVHDFDPNEDAPPLSEQIGEVQEKYRRRIEYFYQCITEPTLFFHFEYHGNADYWKENYSRVQAFFKKFNPDNELIVICYGNPEEQPDLGFPYYYTKSEKDDHFVGYYVESNPGLSKFMHDPELIPYRQRLNNLRFFIDKQLGSNREISMNEMRIARDKLKSEQDIWKGWVRALQSGRTLTARLLEDGIKKVGIFGYTDFYEQTVEALREAGITCDFVMSWYLRDQTEAYGVPTYDPHEYFEKMHAERKAKEEAGEEVKEMSEEEWLDFWGKIPKFKEIDALIAVDVEDKDLVEKAPGHFPCKVYGLTQLLGI